MPNDPRKLVRTLRNYVGAVFMLCLCILLCDNAIPQITTSPSASQIPTSGSRVRHRPKGVLVSYHEIISAVDKDMKTFTIEGRRESRVLKIIDRTSITKNGQTVTIDDITKDDEVTGSYLKDADGMLLAKSVKIGPVKRKATHAPTASPI
jgi:hypothetical protein